MAKVKTNKAAKVKSPPVKLITPEPLPDGGKYCQESSGISVPYVAGLPCLRPAKLLIRNDDPRQYAMCPGCADHNIMNRGAKIVAKGEKYELYSLPTTTPHSKGNYAPSPQEAIPDVEEGGSGTKVAVRPTALPRGEELLTYVRKGMEKFIPKVRGDLDAMVIEDRPASELAQVYYNLRQAYDIIEEAFKAVRDVEVRMADVLLPLVFEREQIKSFNMTNGYRVGISQRFIASIIPEMKDSALEWMRGNQMGDLIQPTVNSGTLSAEGKKMLEDGKELPDTLFRTYIKPQTSLTKVPARK